MSDRSTFMISTAIPYANGAPHMGHAYERIACDFIARYKRLDGVDTLFVTGMDEHGQKVQRTAEKEGVTPQAFVDAIADKFAEMGALLNAPTDDVVRTTQARHKASVQAIWEKMQANGDIYLAKYSGWYSVRDEAYYDESELKIGEGGQKLSPQDTPVEWMEEESYFFRLSAYGEKLLKLYEDQPDFITPAHYRNEIVAFVKRGLADLSVSRTTFDWGIPVPGDPKHIMYVWVDALTNYITATGYPDLSDGKRKYWPADVHCIGKDITRFHAIYWPAFLMSAGEPLPKQIVVHGFLFNKGEKMSKSTGNVIGPSDLVNEYGLDQTRYFFLREVSFGQDGSYSHEAIVQRVNADLANGIGNLAQRSLSMIQKNCEGRAPAQGPLTSEDRAILDLAYGIHERTREAMKSFSLHQALAEIWKVIGEADRYFASQAPWTVMKTDPERAKIVLGVTAELVRVIAIHAQPAMPGSMAKMLDLLGQPADARSFAHASEAHRLPEGRVLPPPQGIFPRYVEKKA
jgi:methionyl-tRNA synthetase